MHKAEKSGLKRIRQIDLLQKEKYNFLSEIAVLLSCFLCFARCLPNTELSRLAALTQ